MKKLIVVLLLSMTLLTSCDSGSYEHERRMERIEEIQALVRLKSEIRREEEMNDLIELSKEIDSLIEVNSKSIIKKEKR